MTIKLENDNFEVSGIVNANQETMARVQAFASEWLTSLRRKYPDYNHLSVKRVCCDMKRMEMTIGTATFGRRFK